MSVLYRKHHFLKNSCNFLISFSRSRHLLPFSTLTAENPHPKDHFIVDYLVNTCGFSRQKAADASTTLTSIHSPENPDSVLNFLRGYGLNGIQIKSIIAWRPQLLSANVEKTLVPKIRILQELGLSGSSLTKLIMSKPTLLFTNAAPFINFLRPLLGSNENVIKALNRSQWTVANKSIETLLQPNISFLKEYGVSNEMIAKFTTRYPNFFFQYPERLKDTVNRVEKMGVTHQNGMFMYAVHVIGSMSKTTLDAKFELFKSVGWSEADVISAFIRAPDFIKCSGKKIRASMDYVVRELEYSPSYVVSYPKLLTYSLGKRVIPRFNVLRILKSKELLKRSLGLYTVVSLSEEKFLEQFLYPHVESAPEVLEAYKGCISEVPPLR